MYSMGSIQGLFRTLFPMSELAHVTLLVYQLEWVLVLILSALLAFHTSICDENSESDDYN